MRTITHSSKYMRNLKGCCAFLQQQVMKSSLLLILVLITGVALAQNPRIENGVAIYHSNKNIGQKFEVPNSWDKILIKENVTITGSFYMPNRTRPIEIAGENRKTSVIKGTGNGMHHQGDQAARQFSAIRCDKSPDVYIHDLKSYNPDKFHISAGFGNVTVERCDIVDDRGQHTTDGVHGGYQKTVVKDCYIDTHDDALYVTECKLVENTTIVHNHNGSPFQVSWGKSNLVGAACTIRNCKVIDASTKNSDYNQGVVSWAGRSGSGNYDITLTFEGAFERETKPGANVSHMYQIGRKSGGITNCTIKINGLCQWQNSQKIYGNTNSKVVINGCNGNNNNPDVVNITDINDLSATAISCTSVKLEWSDIDGEDGYRIRRKIAGASTYNNLTDVAAGATSYTDATALENTAYEYMVRPLDGGTAVALSNVPSVVTPSCDNGGNDNGGSTGGGGDCSPWFSNNGVWKGKGRIAISSDGNEHDKDDWAATPFSLALLAAKGLQDQLTLYTYSDHVWGSNHDHSDARQQMRTSALEGAQQFGFDNTTFMEAVADPNAAYNAMAAEINASSANNPLFIIAAGPMHVVGQGLDRAQQNKLQYVTVISHSNWNNRHSDNPNNWENHSGWTWDEMVDEFQSNGVRFDHITDQNGGNGYDGMRAAKSKFSWINTSSARNNPLYKSGSWAWLYDRQEAAQKGNEFDPSDAGMIIYLLTGKEKTDPSDAKAIMESPVAPCSGDDNNNGGGGNNDDCEGYVAIDGIIMMEAENTDSPLGEWIVKTDNPGFTGSGHLEFTGNGINGGPATSPLEYTFKVSEAGYYRLHMRVRKRLEGAESDKSNDGYVKLAGDFDEGPNAGNNHNDDAPESMLRQNTKFFGGPANGWGWASKLDPGGHDNKRNPIYYLKAGETYTLTLSGRSIRWNVDRIVFAKTSIANNVAFAVTEETGCSDDNGGGNDCDINVATSKTDVTCDQNGSITLLVNNYGSRTFIKYKVGNAAYTENVTTTDSYTASNLASGSYPILAEWGNGDCPNTNVGSVSIQDNCDEPTDCDINVTIASTDITCSEAGSATLAVNDYGTRVNIRYKVGDEAYTENIVTSESYTVSGLAIGSYPVLAVWGNGDCADTPVGIIVITENCSDADGDGIPDSEDECPNDATNTCNEPEVQSPQDVSLVGVDCQTVLVSWSDVNAGEEAYRVRRKVEGEATYANIGDVGPGATSFVDETVEENVAYVYMVRGLYSGVAQGVSNTPSITVSECVVTSVDSDGDSTPDSVDECPNDPNKVVPGDCGCGVAEATCNPVNELYVHIHPNPFTNEIRLTFNIIVTVQSVQLVDMMGDAQNVQVDILSGNQIYINTSNVTGGQYQLIVVAEEGIASRTVIKLN